MYPEMAATAREEGFTRLAYLFEAVAAIEKEHEERYLKLLANLVKPSSRAVAAISGYMLVHSSFSPAAAAFRFSAVSPMPPRCV